MSKLTGRNKGKRKMKSGSTHSSGATALSFKKGSRNYTETPVKKVRTERYKWKDEKKRPKPSQQSRGSGETYSEFKSRREKYRKSRGN